MVWSDEVDPVRVATGMPLEIVQGAQYMNDVIGSVYGKLTHAVNYQRNTEFRGGIWDCNPVEEKISPKPSVINTSNNSTNKILSLEEILACDDDDVVCDDTEMTDDSVSKQNKEGECNVNASCTDVSFDVNHKRWRSEEFDKASLLPCHNNEITRKKSKKHVSFSDIVVDLEDLSKSAIKTSEFVELDSTAVAKSGASCLTERVIENKREMNSVPLVSENTEMEDKGFVQNSNSVKESTMVKNETKLMPQSFGTDEQLSVEVVSSKKSSRGRNMKQKAKSDVIAQHKTVTKKSTDNHKAKNEELMNRSRLQSAIPELFKFNEFATEDKADPSSAMKVKNKLKCIPDELEKNLIPEIKGISNSRKQSSLGKGIHSHTEVELSKTEVISKTYKEEHGEDDMKSNKVCLKESLLKMFNDSAMAENITNQLEKLAEQKKKTANVIVKDKIIIDDKQMECGSVISHEDLSEEKSMMEQTLSEDESQYEMGNSKILRNQQKIEKKDKVERNVREEMAPKGLTVCKPRSEACTNWRSECADVRLKGNMPTQASITSNWRSECREQKVNPRGRNYYSRNENFKKQQESEIEETVEYEGQNERVIPFYLKEPPEPLSRFRIKTDPESIWETNPSQNLTRINQLQWKTETKAQIVTKEKLKIPRFFEKTFMEAKSSRDVSEEIKNPTPKNIQCTSSALSNENCRSRSQSRQGNFNHHRSYERNRSSSARPFSAVSLEHDIFYNVKITSQEDDTFEKLKILKENFLLEVKGNSKLSDIIPFPGQKPRRVCFSASAVVMFLRCLFCLSYKIPSWIAALEAFALAKKFGVNDLKRECENYFRKEKIQSKDMPQVSACALQLKVFDALKFSKDFQNMQSFKSFSDHNTYTPQSCTVSCSVLVDPSEFVVPLISEISRGLESCNVSDVRNRVFLTSLAHATVLNGIQMKFLAEDINAHLKIICEIFQTKKREKLFSKELDAKAKASIKISFGDEIIMNSSEEVEIVVYIEDVLLKICPQVTDNEFVSPGKFRVKLDSSKANEKNRHLFCIEKILYTSQSWLP